MIIMPHDDYHEWVYTEHAGDKFGEYYVDRRLIGRDTPIRGGVYYGTYGGEAIVVDPTKSPEHYTQWYRQAEAGATKNGVVQRDEVLRSVYDTVRSQMRYSRRGVENTLASIAKRDNLAEFEDGTKVELSVFMGNHVGVCRHQALAVGALLETFKDNGHIRGDVSIDRNIRWSPNGEADGHAWTRYTAQSGMVVILDVAQGYYGTLENSPKKAHWNYLRPEEQRLMAAPDLGQVAILDQPRPDLPLE